MENAHAVTRATHPGIRYSDHVADSSLQQLFGDGQHAPLGHPRSAGRAGILEDDDAFLGDVEIVAVYPRLEIRIVAENHCWAAMPQQFRIGCSRFDNRTI